MRYHIFHIDLTKFSYAFSVDAYDTEQLVGLILAKWTLSNEVAFLKKAGMDKDPYNILSKLRAYEPESVNCIIVSATDSCFRTFDDMVDINGLHIFQPVGWDVPKKEELILLPNKYNTFIDIYYHHSSKSVWIQFNKHSPISMVKIYNIDVITEYISQVESIDTL